MEESTAPTESETAAPEEGNYSSTGWKGTTVAPEEGNHCSAGRDSDRSRGEQFRGSFRKRETESATEAEQTEPENDVEALETTEEKAQEPEKP